MKKAKGGSIHDTYILKKHGIVLQKEGQVYDTEPEGRRLTIAKISEFLKEVKFPSAEIATEWRVYHYREGKTLKSFNLKQAQSALKLTLRFHKATAEYWGLPRLAMTVRCVPKLKKEYAALNRKIRKLAIFERIIHGDLKCGNYLFKKNKAVALIDLDTVRIDFITWDIANMIFSWGGGETGKLNKELILLIKKSYAGVATLEEYMMIHDFVKILALEYHYRYKDYKYFNKLSREYCKKRSRNALKFYESFDKWHV